MLVSLKISAKNLDVSSRRKRKSALFIVITMLEKIIDAEEAYMDNMPANLQNSLPCYYTGEHIRTINRALDFLHHVYMEE